MKEIIFHLGPAKTGTTFTQKVFFDNYLLLKSKGILYPKSCDVKYNENFKVKFRGVWQVHNAPLKCHHKLAWALRKTIAVDNLFLMYDELKKEIEESGVNKVFLSSESFPGIEKDALLHFKQYFADFKFKIVFMHRPLESWFKSVYNQEVKLGRIHSSLADFIRDSSIENFYNSLNNWTDVFGKENLKIISSKSLENENSFKLVFSEILNDSINEIVFGKKKSNVSLNNNVLNALLHLNRLQKFSNKLFKADYLYMVLRNLTVRKGFVQTVFNISGKLLPNINSSSNEEEIRINEFKKDWYNDYLTTYIEVN